MQVTASKQLYIFCIEPEQTKHNTEYMERQYCEVLPGSIFNNIDL